jgi:sucrose-6-phosphate hydrolase SacC (GH32 family)
VYHFTWSCDDTGSENYHVNYGISDNIYGPVEYKGTVLQKEPEQNILGTGHHCIFQIPGKDEYYIGYHRFGTPLENYDKDKKGFNRELCLERVSFDETTGLMKPIVPTTTGIGGPVSPYEGYLFAYFTESNIDGENIYFAYSEDGFHFHQLNNGKWILTSELGEKGLRDPFILRSVQGDTFYLVATDLSIGRDGDWGRSQRAGSHSIMVWESHDLIHWSDQRMVNIARADAGCTWAPEFIFDEEQGAYMIFWASRIAEDNYAKQRLYCAWTKDFITFTEPQVYIDKERDTIDTSIIKYKGCYYRMTKDETRSNIILETSSRLNGTWTVVDAPVLNAQQGVEGPEFYRINGTDQVCVIVDQYGGKGYYPLITDDLSTGEFRTLEENEYSLPHSRHGSVIPITGDELKRLKEAFLFS